MRMGIPVALGPDWTWSGSINPQRELLCAKEYLLSRNSEFGDQALWEMATTNAARAVGLDGVLGSLVAGNLADIAVYKYNEHPYQPVIDAVPTDSILVIVGGQALYGSTTLMDAIADTSGCEVMSACGEDRSFCTAADSNGQQPSQLESALSGALSTADVHSEHEYTRELLGLWLCEETRADCDISVSTELDSDGDGIDNDADSCPDSQPGQDSLHGDTLGTAVTAVRWSLVQRLRSRSK